MERKAVGFEQLSDIFGFRVIVDDVAECYRALGIVHTTWPVVPGRFKDYISTPKQNDYRSIHSTVIGPGKQRVELQIRTREMHQIAEYGIAAHALYKDGVGSPTELLSRESNAYAWLRRTIELLAEGSNPEEFLEHTKLELFQDQVFCFTPKGKLIALPRGATPIDFAYAVHTDVGNMAIGAKINGQIAPLVSALQNGDEVRDPDLEGADRAAGGLGIDRRHRQGARRDPARHARRGAQSIFRARPAHRRAAVPARQDRLLRREAEGRAAAARARLDRRRDVGGRPRRDEGRPTSCARCIPTTRTSASTPLAPKPESGWFGLKRAKAVKFKVPESGENGAAIPIRGINTDLPVRFAPNGGAVPGDRIVGIMTPGEGITIYPIHSPALNDFEDEPERWLDVRWDVDDKRRSVSRRRLAVQSVNEPGSLAQIAQVIAEHDGNIDNIRMTRQSPDFTEMTIDLEVYNLKHLTSIISQLRAKKVVANAERVNG